MDQYLQTIRNDLQRLEQRLDAVDRQANSPISRLTDQMIARLDARDERAAKSRQKLWADMASRIGAVEERAAEARGTLKQEMISHIDGVEAAMRWSLEQVRATVDKFHPQT